MTRRFALLAIPLLLLIAFAVSSVASVDGSMQAKGRYKKQGTTCVWDANDGGPDQCTPIVKGRFKKGAKNECTWEANDVGADQCRPAKGRWKKGGDNSCAWDPNDGGADQCNPRQAR